MNGGGGRGRWHHTVGVIFAAGAVVGVLHGDLAVWVGIGGLVAEVFDVDFGRVGVVEELAWGCDGTLVNEVEG